MTVTNRGMSRRRFLGTSAALAGGFALTPDALRAAPGTISRISRAAAQGQQFQGQIVIGTSANPDDAAKQALAEAYRQQQPGVEIVWETQDREPAEYTSWLGTQLAAGDIELDIVSGNYLDTFRGYVNLDQYRRTTNPYTGNPWDQDLDWDFLRAVNEAGERTMLATRSVHINWFYNQDLFEQAGVTVQPTTWAEFGEVCATLQEAGITPIAANFDWQVPQWFAEVYFDQYHTHWVETVRAKEGDWNYDPELDGAFVYNPENPNLHNTYTYNVQRFLKAVRDGELRFDTPEIEAVAGNMAQIFPQYATGDFFVIGDPYPTFLQQQVAIIPNGSWALGQLKVDLEALSPERLADLEIEEGTVKPFTWSTFENPSMESGPVKSPVRSVESATGEYVSVIRKEQEQTNMAVDFAMFWLSPAGYEPYLDALAQSPGFSPGGPLEVQGVSEPAEIQQLFADLKMLGNAETNYNGFWTGAGGAGTPLFQDVRNLFKSMLEKSITPAEYGKRLQETITSNFDTILESSGLTEADIENPARQPGT